MQIHFTINCILDIPNQAYRASVQSVVTPQDEDITKKFEAFCSQNGLPLTTEDQIRTAAFEYGKKYQ